MLERSVYTTDDGATLLYEALQAQTDSVNSQW